MFPRLACVNNCEEQRIITKAISCSNENGALGGGCPPDRASVEFFSASLSVTIALSSCTGCSDAIADIYITLKSKVIRQ